MVNLTDQDRKIRYLVERKYPPYYRIKASGANQHTDYLRTAKAYEKELSKLEYGELSARYDMEQQKEREETRQKLEEKDNTDFHFEGSQTDVSYWSKMEFWTSSEALMLSFGKDPKAVGEDKISHKFIYGSPFAKEYMARKQLFDRAKLAQKIYESTVPMVFISWAESIGIEYPKELVNLIKERSEKPQLEQDYKDMLNKYTDLIERHGKAIEIMEAQADQIETLKAKLDEIEHNGGILVPGKEPEELMVAMAVYRRVATMDSYPLKDNGKPMTVRQTIETELAKNKDLGSREKERIAAVCNWIKGRGFNQ